MALAEEFFVSCTMAAGQFCTNPGFILVPATPESDAFVQTAAQRFAGAAPGTLLTRSGVKAAKDGVELLQKYGAKVLCGGEPASGSGFRFHNTLLTITGEQFLQHPEELQTEVFGPVALVVTSADISQTRSILRCMEGSLTGTIYSGDAPTDAEDYAQIEPILRRRVGRLVGNRMPTGVAVSPAMNHGGPFPATAHPGFTSVGLPFSAQRFAALHCYDNVAPVNLSASIRKLLS
jgi:NADP-dependent aldehyde dehydrogenase